jgi:phosphoheptose isomerase
MPSQEQMRSMVVNAGRRGAYTALILESYADEVVEAARVIATALAAGNKILVCGNGGSAACAQHFAAEFTGKLFYDRRPFPAIALSTDTSALTAIANDYGYEDVFARQVRALGQPGDVLVGISTSGSSANVRTAVAAANDAGLRTIALTGKAEALGAERALRVPLGETARIQEAHDLILHELAQLSERLLVPEMDDDASADRFPFVLADSDLAPFREWMTRSRQELVTTNGVFDVIHQGHHRSLREARVFGDRLVVLVNSDDSVRRLKGPGRPIRALTDRLGDLERSPFVDHVVVMSDDVPSPLLSQLHPAVHCKGQDYQNVVVPEEVVVAQYGGRMEYLTLVDGYSTTSLESKVREGA